MTNIITAIINLSKLSDFSLRGVTNSHNRTNSMGELLETFVKDLFCGTVGEKSEITRKKLRSKYFSYDGNQNNPPDAIIKDGDAIEIKKIESDNSALALNSSYPKSKLYATNPMLSKACINCENWDEKDMLYVVGVVKESVLKSLAFVYGEEYCADKEVYEKIKDIIKNGVESIPQVEFSETKELGRVNRVDPLGITSLRVRGMWTIENPFVVFDYIYKRDFKNNFNFMCIISKDKFDKFNNKDDLLRLVKENSDIKIEDVKISSPNNPAKMREVKLISLKK